MAEPQIGSRDSQGRYYHGPVKGYMSLSDLMKDYNKTKGPGLFGIKQGETRKLPGVGDIVYDKKYGWQTKATYERGLIEPSKRPPKPVEPTSGMSAAEIKAAQDAANKARRQGKLSDLRGASTDVEVKQPEVKQPEVKQPEVKRPESKPTLDPKLKADLDKFAPKINQNWAAANERLARVELARAQQRAAGKSVFDKQFRQTKVNPIMYKQPSVEKEAYEVVLDYLLSEGHAETVEEAHYVMMQLDAEYVQSIVEDSAPVPNIPPEKPKDKERRKPPADTPVPPGDGQGPEEGGVYDREVRVPPNSYGDLRVPPNKKFDRSLGGPQPGGTGSAPRRQPNTNTSPKPRKPIVSLYPGEKNDGLLGPYLKFGNSRIGIPNISPVRPDNK